MKWSGRANVFACIRHLCETCLCLLRDSDQVDEEKQISRAHADAYMYAHHTPDGLV